MTTPAAVEGADATSEPMLSPLPPDPIHIEFRYCHVCGRPGATFEFKWTRLCSSCQDAVTLQVALDTSGQCVQCRECGDARMRGRDNCTSRLHRSTHTMRVMCHCCRRVLPVKRVHGIKPPICVFCYDLIKHRLEQQRLMFGSTTGTSKLCVDWPEIGHIPSMSGVRNDTPCLEYDYFVTGTCL